MLFRSVLPKDGKPVTRWADQADAFLDVELGIRRVVESLIAERQAAEAARIQEAEAELKRQQEAARLEQERLEQERLAAEQRQREQAEAARREQERLEQERKEQERLAEERRQQEQAEAQRREQERLEEKRKEQERLAAEKRQREAAEIQRIEQERQQQLAQQTTITALPPTKTFEFEVVTLNNQGQEQTRTRNQTQYFTEDLGNGTWLDMVVIPGGSFMMGSPDGEGGADERPQHQVTVQPFCMGKLAVTQAQWRAVAAMPKVRRDLEADPSRFKGAMRPVECVSWHDAVEFCQRLSRHTSRQYRLPSEAEWEYACRAGTKTPFHFGAAISRDFVNCKRNLGMALISIPAYFVGSGGETTEVGSFKAANTFGLYDMHGNVQEWCQDVWHDNYEGAPTDGFAWLEGGNQERRVLRGGSWYDYPVLCRSALRYWFAPVYSLSVVGFRVVCGGA